jgi:hypothetical protein
VFPPALAIVSSNFGLFKEFFKEEDKEGENDHT